MVLLQPRRRSGGPLLGVVAVVLFAWFACSAFFTYHRRAAALEALARRREDARARARSEPAQRHAAGGAATGAASGEIAAVSPCGGEDPPQLSHRAFSLARWQRPDALAHQARIVPAVRDGRPIGFRLFSIRRASPYAAIGLKNGDVITGVNGLPVSTPDHALARYQQLRSARSFHLDVCRRGRRHLLLVDLVGER